MTVRSIASPILPVYLSFFVSNYKISCSLIPIIYELNLDMMTALHRVLQLIGC